MKKLTLAVIIQPCYICEDDEHMKEIAKLIASAATDESAKQEIWFTTDLRIFNYSYENERFFRLKGNGNLEKLDLKKRLGIGSEYKY